MPPNTPQHETLEPPEPEPDIRPEPRMPRFISRVGWIALIVGLYGIFMTDIGDPVTLPNGTEQSTWPGMILGVMSAAGLLIVVFSATPWGLLQAVCIIAGPLVGIQFFMGLGPNPPHGVGLIGAVLGLLVGWGVGFLLTRFLSTLFDVIRRLVTGRRHTDLQQRINRQGGSDGHTE